MPTAVAAAVCRGSRSRKHASAPKGFCRRPSSGSPDRFSLTSARVSGYGCDRTVVGRVVDPESGLIYLINRYYDPQTAQFMSVDPAVALTQSAYGYVGDNPLNGADPTGLSQCGQLSLGGLVDCASIAAQNPIGTFTSGWNSMSTGAKIVDATLPITLPLTVLGVVSGVADVAGASVFGLSAGGTTAVALASGTGASVIDIVECRALHSSAACIGAAAALSALGVSGAGALAGGSETLLGGLLASQGLAIGQAGALWDLVTGIRDLLRVTTGPCF